MGRPFQKPNGQPMTPPMRRAWWEVGKGKRGKGRKEKIEIAAEAEGRMVLVNRQPARRRRRGFWRGGGGGGFFGRRARRGGRGGGGKLEGASAKKHRGGGWVKGEILGGWCGRTPTALTR